LLQLREAGRRAVYNAAHRRYRQRQPGPLASLVTASDLRLQSQPIWNRATRDGSTAGGHPEITGRDMDLMLTYARSYPWQSFLMVTALLLAGLAEGSSLSALLPLATFAVQAGGDSDAAPVLPDSGVSRYVTELLDTFGVEPSIGSLLVFVVIGVFVKNVLVLFAEKQVGYTKARVATDLRLRLLTSVLESKWGYFVTQPTGRLTNSMATEAWRAAQAYEFGATIVALLIQAMVYTIVALAVSWQAVAGSLVAAVVILAISHFLVRMTRRAGKRQTIWMKSLLARMTDTLRSVRSLKAMGREDLAGGVLAVETNKVNRALEKEVFSKAALSAVQEPLFAVVMAIGMFVLLKKWGMPIAEVMVLLIVLTKVLSQLGKIQKYYQKMVAAGSAYWSLQEAVDEAANSREDVAGEPAPRLDKGISLRSVSFAHDERKVLDNVSIEIPAGCLTTLIGPSGSGKTTVLDLIMGLHRPTEGEVLIDGVPMQKVDIRSWRRQIGYVPQETLLLHDSVFNNVTLGDPDLDESQAERALRAAEAWDFVAAMPDGLHATVGEGGARFSSGQRQRIMLARALAHNPRLLVLDEATSALDPSSEAEICATLTHLAGRLTILAVSHQPALAEVADRVYRLADGKLVDDRLAAAEALPATSGS
jgi:ATP-binding cassette subfamily C protein